MKKSQIWLLGSMILALVGCRALDKGPTIYGADGEELTKTLNHEALARWGDTSNWYDTGRSVDEGLVDVFYIVSTEILDEKDSLGVDHYIGRLTPPEREAFRGEMQYIRTMFGDSVNFFSPYYHQFTMSALRLPAGQQATLRRQAYGDVAEAFAYYLRHLNGGRPFILAGFSQGSMHLVELLRNIPSSDYQRMVTAYCMGYRLSADDLQHPFVRAASSADDLGTIVSFNSVASPDAIWPAITDGAVTCMNPINYRTDDVPATFTFKGDTLTVSVDTVRNVLVVNSPRISSYRFPILEEFCPAGNLHHWDLLFYGEAIRRNAMHRAYERKGL